jgi:hypothetical protein
MGIDTEKSDKFLFVSMMKDFSQHRPQLIEENTLIEAVIPLKYGWL